MSSRKRAYHRRTSYIPQDERNLTLEPILNDPVDMSDLVDAILMHAISKNLDLDTSPAAQHAIGRRFPHSRVPRLATTTG